MHYDPRDPHNRASDAFVLSKGHAAPILYAACAETGAFPREKLLTLREIDSDFEAHPTPRLPYVDVAATPELQALPERRFDGVRFATIFIDGVDFDGEMILEAKFRRLKRYVHMPQLIRALDRLGEAHSGASKIAQERTSC